MKNTKHKVNKEVWAMLCHKNNFPKSHKLDISVDPR